MWKVFSRHLAVSLCLTVLVIAFQVILYPTDWVFFITHCRYSDGTNFYLGYTGTSLLEDRWVLDDLKYGSGIAYNKLVMLQGSSMKARESVAVAGRPWEIVLTWEDGCKRRPHRRWFEREKTGNTSFSLTFSNSDRNRFRFDLDPDTCGLYLEDQGGEHLVGECAPSYGEAIDNLSHTLSLKGEHNVILASVDDIVYASATTDNPIDQLTIELETAANSCVTFDDLGVRTEEAGSGWTTHMEEHFEANPFQTSRIDSLFDMDSKISWIIITLVSLVAALLLDLVGMALIGRRSPIQALLATAVPQALMILAIQNIFLLPFVPQICSVVVVWTSKILISLFVRPQEELQIYYKRPWPLLGLVAVTTFLALILVLRTESENTVSIVGLASVQVAVFLILLAGQWTKPECKWGLVLWSSLCGIQVLHWFWIREVWSLFGFDTFVFVTFIPTVLIMGLYASAIRRPGWVGISGRLLAVVLALVCVEFAVRPIPVSMHLDFDSRIENVFWDLREDSNLIFDHSREEMYKDSMGATWQREKASGLYRIVCLGSSSTQGATEYLDFNEIGTWSYPAQLGRLMNGCLPGSVEVINAGVGGYTLTKLRIYFEHILSGLDPDLLILYFGLNGDDPSDLAYYERVESLLEDNPKIGSLAEIEAGLSLRWPHRIFIRTYLFLAKSRLFIGMKLILDEILLYMQDDAQDKVSEQFKEESAGLLVEAALNTGALVLLIPEITNRNYLCYESVFEKSTQTYADEPVHILKIDDFDTSSYIFDNVHMTADGYGALARIIADYLVRSGLVRCDPVKNDSGG